jgi:hypothetical protein
MSKCCDNVTAQSSATSFGIGVYDTVITCSASATASAKTYDVALEKASTLAKTLADNLGVTSVNNLNQTIDVVNTNIIPPIQSEIDSLNSFVETINSSKNITLDGVVACMNQMTTKLFITNYVYSLINQYTNEIIANGGDYNAILRPILEKMFGVGTNEFYIIALFYTDNDNKIFDYSKMMWTVNGYPSYNILNNMPLTEIQNYVTPVQYQAFVDVFHQATVVLADLQTKYPDKDTYYYVYVPNFVSPTNPGRNFVVRYYRKDVLDSKRWIHWNSTFNYGVYIPVPAGESFVNFISRVQDEINNIENYPADNIWQYDNTIDPLLLKCLYSKNFPWTDKYISDCFIPGSDIDVPGAIYTIIDQLKTQYYEFSLGQIAVVTYSLGENYYTSICQLIEYNGVIAFSERQISINEYINTPFKINNDTVIKGYLEVKSHDDQTIIKTDNYKKITSINQKVGINQEISQVKGLLDVDNLSNLKISDIMTSMTDPLLNSYTVINDIKSQLSFGTTSVVIPDDYVNDVVVFKCPVLNKIEQFNISFLYVPSETAPFGSESFAQDSFLRIQNIVNEINKLIPNYQTFLLSPYSPGEYTFSFFELLNDTKYWYLNSLRAVLKENPNDLGHYEMFFVMSSFDVNDILINKSLIQDFTAYTDKTSAANRFLNFCVLISYQESVYDGLLNGKSIGSTDPNQPYFSDVINENPYFFNRLGYPEFKCFSDLYTLIPEQCFTLLSEQYTYLNAESSNTQFLPNTDRNLATITVASIKKFEAQFGSPEQQTFYEYYYWNLGPKLSFTIQMPFNESIYTFGIGLDISSVISESIVLKGDNKITGNMSLIDSTNETYIFSVDTVNKSAFSIYNTGIGLQEPQSKLDILDCGISDVISINNNLAYKLNTINYNIVNIVNAGNTNGEEGMFDYLNNSQMINPVSSSPVFQTIDDYFSLYEVPSDLDPLKTKDIYHWLYKEWEGKTFNYLLENDITNREAVKLAIEYFETIYTLNEFFSYDNNNYSFANNVNAWVFGTKFFSMYFFKLNNGKFYILINGVNIQKKLSYETNKNIQTLMDYYVRYGMEIQRMNVQINNIPPSEILNEEKSAVYREIYKNKYPLITVAKYDINFNTNSITYSQLDYNTLNVIFGPIDVSTLPDLNLRNQILNFVYQLEIFYYRGESQLNKNNCGVLSFENNVADLFSFFYVLDANGKNSVSILSLENQTNLILKPSLNLQGDQFVSGDMYVYDKNLQTNFLFADSNNKFLGLNTLEVFANYDNSYDTTSDNKIAKQTAYFRSVTFPNTVLERNAEELPFLPKDPFYFSSFTTLSSRRQSDFYSFEEMDLYSKDYHVENPTGVINAFGDGQENKYGYGSSISFELKDKSGVVKEVGNFSLVMENYDDVTGNVDSGFSVYTNYTNPETNKIVEKNILYVDNNSQLSVNSIQLGGNTNSLYVDENGNLRFGSKYLVLSDTPPPV